MGGVVVHYYVWEYDIWQNLNDNERGWHAADGSTRKPSQRLDNSKIGGNLDTIAIECVGNNSKSEDTTAKLAAYLCHKYGLNPSTDIYTHKYFYPKKTCPIYILPHWSAFLNTVKKYYNELKKSNKTPTTSSTKPTNSSTTTSQNKPATTKKTYKKGDIVTFKGTKHFISAASSLGSKCKPGKAKVTNVKEGKEHPYHLIRVSGGGSTVYGWVNSEDIE